MAWVYVLDNPAFPNLIKIGYTDRSPTERIEELSRATSVPEPFTLLFACELDNADRLEKDLHQKLERFRKNKAREFFKTNRAEVLRALQLLIREQDLKPRTTIGFELLPQQQVPRTPSERVKPEKLKLAQVKTTDPYEGKKGRLGLKIEHTQDLHRYMKRNSS
jgi:hypothetical protein